MKWKLYWPLIWLGMRVGLGLSCVVVILGTLIGAEWWYASWSMVLDIVGLSLGGIFVWSWLRKQKRLPDWFGLFDMYGKYFFSVMMSWWFTLLLVVLFLISMLDGFSGGASSGEVNFSKLASEVVVASSAFNWAFLSQLWVLIRFMIMNLVGPVLYFLWLHGASGVKKKRAVRRR